MQELKLDDMKDEELNVLAQKYRSKIHDMDIVLNRIENEITERWDRRVREI